MKNNKVYREELIEHIKACGQSIIDHAEEIVGNYKFDTGTYIELHVGDRNEAPYISVTKDFIPEKFIENITKNYYRNESLSKSMFKEISRMVL